VVVGGSKGIGLELVKRALANTAGPVVLAARNPQPDHPSIAPVLAQYGARLQLTAMDITEEASIRGVVEHLSATLPCGVEVLVNTVGILHNEENMPERKLDQVDKEWMMRNFEINACGHALVAKHFTPLLQATKEKGHKRWGVLASLSARVGSISDNQLGGWYSYRASKAAQNQLMKTASIELKRKGIIVISLHPGTVATDLSKPFQRNVKKDSLFTTEFSAERLFDIVEKVDKTDTGKFFAWDKQLIPY